MSRPRPERLRVIKAHMIKDLKQAFRFRISLLNTILAPILTMTSFLITYSAIFFGSGTDDLGYIDKGNYIVYILTGFLTYSAFHLMWGRTALGGEKVMLTLQGILLAPGSRLFIVAGKAVRALFEISLTTFFFAVMLVILDVPDLRPMNVLYGVLALFALMFIFLGLDFMLTSVGMAQEGLAGFISSYAPKGFLLLGCVYYPIDVIPEFARPLVYLNPVYHAVNIFRSGFMEADLRFGIAIPLITMIAAAAFLLPASAYVFDWILKKWGIKGY